jgi:hypothetical protein
VTEPIETTEPVTPIETVLDYSSKDFTLERQYKFYKGTVPMSSIATITFSREKPNVYEEEWSASATDADCLKGYRNGNHVYITGENIFTSWDCTNMFTGSIWSNLTSI